MKLICALLALVMATGCAAGSPSDVEDGLPHDPAKFTRAAVFLSSEDGAGDSAVLVVGRDGSERIVGVDPTGDGNVVFDDAGALFVPTSKRSYVASGGKVSIWKHRARTGSVWASPLGGGGFVAAFNTGAGSDGYRTDLWFTRGTKTTNKPAYNVPDSFGIDSTRVYIKDSDDFETKKTVLAVPVTSKAKPRRFSFKQWGAKQGWQTGLTSDLFPIGGRLYFLEDVVKPGKSERPTKFDGKHRSQLRLGSIDLRTATYTSRLVEKQIGADRGLTASGEWSDLGTSTVAAAAQGRSLRWVTATGDVKSVSTRTGKSRTLCRLGADAISAIGAVADWTEDALHLLLTDENKSWLETIDLSDCRSERVQLPKMYEYLQSRDTNPTSLAANPAVR